MRVGRHYAEFSFLERGINAVVGIVGPTFDAKGLQHDPNSDPRWDDTVMIPAMLSDHYHYDGYGDRQGPGSQFCEQAIFL